jgi:hypothetical protein
MGERTAAPYPHAGAPNFLLNAPQATGGAPACASRRAASGASAAALRHAPPESAQRGRPFLAGPNRSPPSLPPAGEAAAADCSLSLR